jgi:hypothetical protein
VVFAVFAAVWVAAGRCPNVLATTNTRTYPVGNQWKIWAAVARPTIRRCLGLRRGLPPPTTLTQGVIVPDTIEELEARLRSALNSVKLVKVHRQNRGRLLRFLFADGFYGEIGVEDFRNVLKPLDKSEVPEIKPRASRK